MGTQAAGHESVTHARPPTGGPPSAHQHPDDDGKNTNITYLYNKIDITLMFPRQRHCLTTLHYRFCFFLL